jgi:pSer/pThr/pTyr-binding forkhead associated (FHA) protein
LIVKDADRTYLVDLREDESLTLGRSARSDLPLTAPRASRHHCEIRAAHGRHLLRDLGSMNGTTLNGAPFEGDVPLAEGDVVDAGGCRFVDRSTP